MFKSKAEAIVQITWCDLERHGHKLISMAIYQVAKHMHKSFVQSEWYICWDSSCYTKRHASANQSSVSRQTHQVKLIVEHNYLKSSITNKSNNKEFNSSLG